MNQVSWPGTGPSPLRLALVASDPVWIGAARRSTLGRGGGRKKWLVDAYERLADVPMPGAGERQFLLIEVDRAGVIATARWLFRRRPLASRWRAGILLPRSPDQLSEQEIGSTGVLLREAGASHLVPTVWDLPTVIASGERFQSSAPAENIRSSLPIAINAEGWQLASRRV